MSQSLPMTALGRVTNPFAGLPVMSIGLLSGRERSLGGEALFDAACATAPGLTQSESLYIVEASVTEDVSQCESLGSTRRRMAARWRAR